MDQKGFVFSTDLLLALVIVTMAMGMMTNQFEELNYGLQDFTSRQSLERTVNDAADYLVKSPGSPHDWELRSQTAKPGLAVEEWNYAIPNYLHHRKVSALRKSHGNLIPNLVHTNNYRLEIMNTTGNPIIPQMGNNPPNTAKEIAIANRSVMLMPGDVLFRMFDLAHLNPGHPSEEQNGHLWYEKQGNPPIYVGPGNVTTTIDPDSSVEISYEDLDIYEFYIFIEGNSGVTSADYGFTDGDAVVNGTYGAFDEKSRQDAIDAELKHIYGGGGWIKLKSLSTGEATLVNDDIRAVLDKGGGPDIKLWLQVKSDPKDTFDISFIKTFKGTALKKIPAKLVLTIWE